MSKSTNRQPLTVRLDPESKKLFSEEAERCGLEPGVAARQILELYVQKLRSGADFVDVLHDLKNAMRAPRAGA